MTQTLAEIFIRNNGDPININGKQAVMSHRIQVTKKQEVEVEFLSYEGNFRQGIELSVDKRKGHIEVNGQKLNSPVLWTDTAPPNLKFTCFPKKEIGVLNIWNVWQYSDKVERIDAWTGNSGIYIEELEGNSIIFNCSSGIGDVDFKNLIIKVTLL